MAVQNNHNGLIRGWPVILSDYINILYLRQTDTQQHTKTRKTKRLLSFT